MSFQDFDLDSRLLKAIDNCGFDAPSDIQQQAIPEILQGHDIMASAPTGTGKTAAFVLPALQRLLTTRPEKGIGPRVLVLTPTRELAKQVTDNIYQFTRYLRMRSVSIVGGMPYPPQIRFLKQRLDFLVATPGRLIDHIEAGRIDFSRIKLLILDEADRMLDMGFVDEVKRIASLIPEERQTLLFSATLEGDIEKVAQRLLKEPKKIQVSGVQVRHEQITQQLHQADDYRHKRSLLAHILDKEDTRQVIVFTSTKKGAEDLAGKLADAGHECAALHGDMRQSMRRRTVESLRRRKLKVLVATDVAARGLDIQGITHVVNFDLPMQAEDYVHRIGRTGRGGESGTAVSLVGPKDWMYLSRIEKLLDARLELTEIPGLEPKLARPQNNPGKNPHNRRKPNIRFKRNGRRANDSRPGQGQNKQGSRHHARRRSGNAETA